MLVNEDVLLEIEKMCKEHNRILKGKELIEKGIISSIYKLDSYVKINYNIEKWQDYFREKGYGVKGDLLLKGKYIPVNKLSLNDLYILVEDFINKNKHMPIVIDFNNFNNLPCWEFTSNLLKKNNISIKEFLGISDNVNRFRNPRSQTEFYNKYVDIFKQEFVKKGYISGNDLNNNNIGLPTAQWLAKYCPDKNVKTYNQFIEWCGFKPYTKISKSTAIQIIYDMQSKLDRPICAEDFKNPKPGELGIKTIRRIWGETWKMQQELGLIITGKHAYKYTTEEIIKSLENLCNYMLKIEHRKIITYKDLRKYIPIDIKTYKRYLGCSIREYLLEKGFDMPNEGNGMNYTFDDGEKVRSQSEFNFSSYLRNKLILKYNINYFRDIKYKTFAKCNKKSNCDYVIDYKGRKIYIEIVGMLKPEKKDTFRTDTYKSKSKEKYRKHLVEKENMFIETGLEYYILFTCDLTDEYLQTIFY